MTKQTKKPTLAGGLPQTDDDGRVMFYPQNTTNAHLLQMRRVVSPLLAKAQRLYERTGDERHAKIEGALLALCFTGGEVGR